MIAHFTHKDLIDRRCTLLAISIAKHVAAHSFDAESDFIDSPEYKRLAELCYCFSLLQAARLSSSYVCIEDYDV